MVTQPDPTTLVATARGLAPALNALRNYLISRFGIAADHPMISDLNKSSTALLSLAERVEADAGVREALQPFADEWGKRVVAHSAGSDLDDWPIGGSSLTYRDLRLAAAALAALTDQERK